MCRSAGRPTGLRMLGSEAAPARLCLRCGLPRWKWAKRGLAGDDRVCCPAHQDPGAPAVPRTKPDLRAAAGIRKSFGRLCSTCRCPAGQGEPVPILSAPAGRIDTRPTQSRPPTTRHDLASEGRWEECRTGKRSGDKLGRSFARIEVTTPCRWAAVCRGRRGAFRREPSRTRRGSWCSTSSACPEVLRASAGR